MEDTEPEQGETVEQDFDFNDYFSLRRPRDAVAGFSSGMKSVIKGAVGGALSLVAAPMVYAQQEGVKGFGKGVAVGVTGAAVLPVVGVAVGVSQFARGIYNTPTALMETSRGRYWDKSKREWVDERPQPLVVQATEEEERRMFVQLASFMGTRLNIDIDIDMPRGRTPI